MVIETEIILPSILDGNSNLANKSIDDFASIHAMNHPYSTIGTVSVKSGTCG
jgi:hypothetical protein